MKLVKSPAKLQKEMLNFRRQNKLIGFVPTMGALHDGHLALVKRARKENDILVVSIFVNPTQFGPGEDYKNYPRNLNKDKALLKKFSVDYLFVPAVEDIYPKDHSVFVIEEQLSSFLCGSSRPGHFKGVCTVVSKLFNIVQPSYAYFGQKDYQQALIIKRMVRDLFFPIKIKIVPIIREKNGLAMSSRNQYLSKEEFNQASFLYQALLKGKEMIVQGEKNKSKIVKNIKQFILTKIKNARIDYVEIVNLNNLKPVEIIQDDVLLALAVYVGKARLIDNLKITKLNYGKKK